MAFPAPIATSDAVTSYRTYINALVGSRGKSIIAATESTSSGTYTLLGTPDRVQSLVLPTDGLIAVVYQARWQASAATAGRAGLFVGSTVAKLALPGGSNVDVEVQTNANTAVDIPLVTVGGGLFTPATGGATGADATTGQVVGSWDPANSVMVGGPCYIFAAAGTYDISVQFRTTSGSVTAKNRKLWAWVVPF